MAESMDDIQNSWWGGWLQSAKEKSLAAVDFVKRDLTEFTNTMSHDTTKIVEITSATIKDTLKAENTNVAKDKVKQSINNLFNGLSKALTVPPDDDDDPKLQQASEGAAIFDRSKARLHAIQVDPGTYLNKPSGPEGMFEDWAKEFKMDDKKGHISEVLVTNVEVRALYTKLVPLQISHADFWQRYFYKLHQLEMDEVRKQAMMKRAEREREESIGWEDDWSGDEEFEDLSNTDLDPASGTVPKSDHDPASSSSTVLKQIPEHSTKTVSPAAESDSANVSSSNLQPVPERGKETLSEITHSVIDGSDVPKNVPASCDNLPSSQNKAVPSKQEKQQPASSVKEDETLMSDVNPAQNATKKKPEPHPSVVEKVPSVTVTSVNTVQDVSSEPSSSPVKLDTQVSPSTLSAAEGPGENISGKDDSSKIQSPRTEVSQQSSQETVANTAPPKTSEADKPSVEVIPEIPQSVLAQQIEGSKVPEKSQLEPETKEEELAGKPSEEALDIKTKLKGDMVVVGSDSESPNSDSSGTKEFLHLVPDSGTEDWEHDFDLEVTEEDLKAADEIAKNLGTDLDLQDDDWENWE